jgi:hypothetical protein
MTASAGALRRAGSSGGGDPSTALPTPTRAFWSRIGELGDLIERRVAVLANVSSYGLH